MATQELVSSSITVPAGQLQPVVHTIRQLTLLRLLHVRLHGDAQSLNFCPVTGQSVTMVNS